MIVQVNTENQVSGGADLPDTVEAEIRAGLDRFGPLVTRVEVHLGDVNSHKGGGADKRCSMEARLAGRQPEAVEHNAATLVEAWRGALRKLQRRLDSLRGKLGEPQREAARRRPRPDPG